MAMLSFLADTDLTSTPLAITTPLADAETQTQHRSEHTHHRSTHTSMRLTYVCHVLCVVWCVVVRWR